MSTASRAPAAKEDAAKGYLLTPIPPTAFGKYTVIGKLGHGGMAEVNLAVVGGKGGFRKLFVIKRLHAHLEAEPGFVDMFLDEARLAAQLDHPHCVQTVEVGEAEGTGPNGPTLQHFLAMEYLDGQGLERLLRITGQRGDILPVPVSVRMIADALDGLGYAHDLASYDGAPLGVVHRDVSPQNIFVTYTGVVKLLDFGIAKAESNVVETRTGVVKGKYAYIAPEQALATPVDRRADLWSMGVVLWEMLTSRRLFKSVNELATLNETLRGEIHPPSRYNPAVPPELDRILDRALQRDPGQRYATAQAFKDDLERWLDSLPQAPDRKMIAALMRDRFGDIAEQQKQRLASCFAAVSNDPRSIERLMHGGATSSSTTSLEADAWSGGSHSQSIPGHVPGHVPGQSPGQSPGQAPGHAPPGHSHSGLSHSGLSHSGLSHSGMTPPPHVPAYSQSMPPGPPGMPMGMHPGMPMPPPGGGTNPGVVAPPQYGPQGHGQGYAQGGYGAAGYGGTMQSGEWGAMPPPGASGAFTAQTEIVQRRRGAAASPSRSVGVVLLAIAACATSAVVAIVLWSQLHGASGATDGVTTTQLVDSTPLASAPSTSPAASTPPPSTLAEPGAATEPSAPSAPTAPAAAPATTAPTSRRDRPRPTTTDTAPAAVAPPAPTTPPPASASSASPAAGTGYLSLVTSPWTQVTMDGRTLGETPLVRVPLPAGTHTLRLRNPEAGIDEPYEVTIRPGETFTRRLGLR